MGIGVYAVSAASLQEADDSEGVDTQYLSLQVSCPGFKSNVTCCLSI